MDATAAARLKHIAEASARDRALIAARRGERVDMDQTGDKVAALLDVARALDAAQAGYALIGGVAVGIHSGVPRATLDVDIAVTSTLDRAAVFDVLTARRFRLVGQFQHSANFRHPSGEPVQLAFDPEFDLLIERAESLQIGDYDVRIVSKEDLIAMKRRAAADPTRRKSKALRDQADIELLLGDVPDPDEGW
jgi:hypothetical protein